MKLLTAATFFCLTSTLSFSQKILSQKQVLDGLLKLFEKEPPTIEAINSLFKSKPTDTLHFAVKDFPGYKKYSVYFLTSSDGNTYDYCMIPLQNLKYPYKSGKLFMSKKLTMWDLIVKNGLPLRIEILPKNEGRGFPYDRLTLNYGLNSHEFLSAPLLKNEIAAIRECAFIFRHEKFTQSQLNEIKLILGKINAEYAYIYSPFQEEDPPPSETLIDQK